MAYLSKRRQNRKTRRVRKHRGKKSLHRRTKTKTNHWFLRGGSKKTISATGGFLEAVIHGNIDKFKNLTDDDEKINVLKGLIKEIVDDPDTHEKFIDNNRNLCLLYIKNWIQNENK